MPVRGTISVTADKRRRGRRQRHRFDAARGLDRHDDLEREDRASGSRDQHARRVAVDERGRAPFEPRAAHEQARRHLDADPSLLQDVDRQPRFARDGVAVDAQLVVDARQRGIDWWRERVWRRRKRARPQRPVVIERQHHPAIGGRGSCARATVGRVAAAMTRIPMSIRVCVNISPSLVLTEGLRPSDSPTRSLARRFAGALRSRGSLAALARTAQTALAIYETDSLV